MSDTVSVDFLCEETVGISNLDDADQLLIDKGSLSINEVIIDPAVCNEEIHAEELSDKPVSNYFYDQFSSPTSTNNATMVTLIIYKVLVS